MVSTVTRGRPSAPTDLTEETQSNPSAPSNLTELAEGSASAPANLTEVAEASPGVPADLTEVAESDPAIPANLAEVAESDPAAPSDLTEVTQANPAAPTNLTEIAESDPSAPTNLAEVAEASPAAPTNLTEVAQAVAAAPVNLSGVAEAGKPRALTPLLNLDFANQLYATNDPQALDDIVTYSRSSSATFWNRRLNQYGKWETFLDTDYVGSVTNLLTYSEQFDNAAWTKTRASIVANAINNHLGEKVADKLVEDATASNTHFAYHASTLTASTGYTFFAYLKAGERSQARILSNVTGDGAIFDLIAGTVVSESGDVVSKINYEGNGWHLASITFDSAAGGAQNLNIRIANGGSESYTGDGASGIYIWGAQLTESAKPLPYIKTLSASASETFTETPRLEYDPITAQPKGLLAEGASTNLFVRSEEFDNASWTKLNATITANDAIAPDGTKSADVVSRTTGGVDGYIYQSISTTTGADYTISVYAKTDSTSLVSLYFGTSIGVRFNLGNGTTSTTIGSPTSVAIETIPNGWFRCSMSFTATSTGAFSYRIYIGDIGENTGALGLYLWGAQCESLPFASSPIFTEGSTVTRVAEPTSSDALANLRDSDFTVHVEFEVDNANSGLSRRLFQETGSSGNIFANINTGDIVRFVAGASGVGTVDFDSLYGTSASATLAYDSSSNLIYSYVNQVADDTGSDAGAFVDAGSAFFIGSDGGTTNFLFGHIKKITVYDEYLTSQEVSLL